MQLDDWDFHVLRWISHFLRDGSASFIEMGSGKVVGRHWDIAEFLSSHGVVAVDTEALTVTLTETGLQILEEHLVEFKNKELIADDSREFLLLCLELNGKTAWVDFSTVPKTYRTESRLINVEVDMLVSLQYKACIEIEGIYPDVKLRVTDKGVRLSRKEIKTL